MVPYKQLVDCRTGWEFRAKGCHDGLHLFRNVIGDGKFGRIPKEILPALQDF